MDCKLKALIVFAIVLVLFSIFFQPVSAQEKKKEDSQVSSQTNGLRTTSITTQAISTTDCSTAPYLGSLSCGGSKSGSGSLASGATAWHKIYASSAGTLTVSLSGPSSADFDLYVYSSCSSSWICRPYSSSSNETCTINATAGSYYYIGINSYSGSGSYTINTGLACGGGTACDSSSYTSCSSAASMSSGSSKSSMCGSQQFYKISTSTPCTVNWSMTPQSTADYDLYVKNSSSSCPSTSSYDCRPYYGTGSQETCSASLPAGTYYALVNKYGGTGSYNIQVNTSNCGSSCTNECSSGQTRCNGSYSQTCGNYDSDSCYEWPSSTSGSGNTYCSYGCNSSTGACYPALIVSISPTNPTVNSGITQTFTASPSGGTGSYSYNWLLSSYTNCTTSSSTSSTYSVTCTNTGSSQISRTVSVTVTSGSQTKIVSTNLYINPATSCNSSSYTSCSSALLMSNDQTQSNMCGSNQFYKIITTQTCDIKWTLTPNNADYDLYSKYSSGSCPSTSNWDCRPYSGGSNQEICTQTALQPGTYYTMVNKYGGTGTYSIKVELSNCGSTDLTMCSAKNWGPTTWANPYIYYTNGTDFSGKLDSYDGYFKAQASFKWNTTNLTNLKNKNPAAVKFEFKRNQTSSTETWDGTWNSDCRGVWFQSNLPVADINGMEETDPEWREGILPIFTCAWIYDQLCAITGNCQEEYQIETKFVNQLSADTTYRVYWQLAVDKDNGSQLTPWEASIELGYLTSVEECYLKRDNWSISLPSTTSYSINTQTIKQPTNATENTISLPNYDRGDSSFKSNQDFLDFKSKKDEETAEIIKSINKPFYVGQTTFKKGLSKTELKNFVSQYKLLPLVVRYKSTIGGGQTYYDYIFDDEKVQTDEKLIGQDYAKDGVKNFRLIEGIVSLEATIPKENVLKVQNDRQVFLLDLGSKESYLKEIPLQRTSDLSYEAALWGN